MGQSSSAAVSPTTASQQGLTRLAFVVERFGPRPRAAPLLVALPDVAARFAVGRHRRHAVVRIALRVGHGLARQHGGVQLLQMR